MPSILVVVLKSCPPLIGSPCLWWMSRPSADPERALRKPPCVGARDHCFDSRAPHCALDPAFQGWPQGYHITAKPTSFSAVVAMSDNRPTGLRSRLLAVDDSSAPDKGPMGYSACDPCEGRHGKASRM